MESRANYAVIGLFILVMIAAGLGFLFWLTGAGQNTGQALVRIIFSGPVTGLTTGSAVTFNGITVGQVARLTLDERDPNTVIAMVRVDRDKPIRTDTRAILSYQGLTGVSNIQLEGGSRNAPLLIEAVDEDAVPTIHAEISPFQDILESVRSVLSRADSAMVAIDDFVTENGPAFNRTVNNVETFSRALARNADNVDDMLANVSQAASALADISESIKGSAERAEQILAAVDPAKVDALVTNMVTAAEDLSGVLQQSRQVVDGIDPAVVNRAVQSVADAATTLQQTIGRADQILAGLDPAEIDALVESLRQTSDDIAAAARRADALVASVDPEKVRTVVDQASGVATALGTAIDSARSAIDSVGNVIAAVDPRKIGAAVDDVAAFTAMLRESEPQVQSIIADVRVASESLRGLGATIDARTGDVDAIIADARTLAGQLTGIAERADGLLQKVDAYVEGDGEGLIAEATATIEVIRQVALTLQERIGPITADVASFTDRGLDSYVRLAEEGRRALSRLDRVLSGVERDPQQFIFGGSDVPEYAPNRR